MLLLLSVLGLVCDPILAGCAAYTMADQDHLGWLTVAGRFLSRRYINLPDINTHIVSGHPPSKSPHFEDVHSFICRLRSAAHDNWPSARSRLGSARESWRVRNSAATT